jgi:hypothetical protein
LLIILFALIAYKNQLLNYVSGDPLNIDSYNANNPIDIVRIKSIFERIENHKGNWLEFILRLTTDRLPKIIVTCKSSGNQVIG